MQDDGFVPVPPPKDTPSAGAKRTPFFGTLAQEARHEFLVHSSDDHRSRKNSSTCPSSDEEERVRNLHAKKARKLSSPLCIGTTSPSDPSTPTTPVFSPVTARKGPLGFSGGSRNIKAENKSSKERKENVQILGKGSNMKPSTKLVPKNLQRNPNMFGPELPLSRDTLPSFPLTVSARIPEPLRSPSPTRSAPRVLASAFRSTFGPSPTASTSPNKAPLSPSNDPSANPNNLRGKTLRRVRRLAPARRISFTSLVPSGHEADADGEGDGEEKGGRIELGSAFQLH